MSVVFLIYISRAGQTCGNLLILFCLFFIIFLNKNTNAKKTNSVFNTYLKYSGYLTVGIDMVRNGRGRGVRGSAEGESKKKRKLFHQNSESQGVSRPFKNSNVCF